MAGHDQVLGAKVRVPRPVVQQRDRLAALFEGAWDHAVSLVVAPAGSGKTTALAQFAAGSATDRRVAWYRAESSEGAVADVLRYVGEALAPVLAGRDRHWESMEAAAVALDTLDAGPVALIIDDFHTLEGTPAETAVGQLVDYLPSSVHLLLGARRPPRFDLSRLRVSGRLLELGPEDLRFRTWEVETLFRDHYGEPLPPVELAELTRRTDGWAAGLQLFHLATRGKPVMERRRVLRSLSTRLRSVREYLARNLLDGLDDELRTFLVRTSVLGHLSATVCDELLGRSDSGNLLAEAERRHLFLTSDDDGATYRAHEVLRSHLAEMLIDEVGEEETRVLQQRAGALLEAAGYSAEALFAYWQAQDWSAADRLLASHTEIVGGPALGLGSIPVGLSDRDGWILLATARRQLAMGAWGAALDTYRRGEAIFGGGRPAATCRRERMALVAWLGPTSPTGGDWLSQLRRALQREPLAVATVLSARPDLHGTPTADLAAGLAAAVAGHLLTAARHLGAAADHPSSSPVVAGFAGFAAAIVHRLRVAASHGGEEGQRELAGAAEIIDAVTPPWLGRLVQGLASDAPGAGRAQLAWARELPDVAANPWAAAVLALLAAATALVDGEADTQTAVEAAESAAASFEALGAGVGVAWARALAALAGALSGDPRAQRAAVVALQAARGSDCPGAMALACRVGALTGLGEERDPLLATAANLEAAGALSLEALVARLAVRRANGNSSAATGTATVAGAKGHSQGHVEVEYAEGEIGAFGTSDHLVGDAVGGQGSPTSPALRIQCFGPFEVWAGERPVDLSTVKPRARAVLQLLAAGGGHPVHRDELLGALWPDDDLRSGTRNLQVAISSLRQVLDTAAARRPGGTRSVVGSAEGGAGLSLIGRESEAYLLALRPGDEIDVATFTAAVRAAGEANRADDVGATIAAGWRALGAYRGELLAGAGSSDWVIERRERFRLATAEVAQTLATSLLDSGDPASAVAAAERGLTVDRYRDGLWRVLVAALEANGDRAAAAKAALDYEGVLTELGVNG